MIQDKCYWCALARDCKRKASLQTRTLTRGGITGSRATTEIKEIVVSCSDFEPLPYKNLAEEEESQ